MWLNSFSNFTLLPVFLLLALTIVKDVGCQSWTFKAFKWFHRSSQLDISVRSDKTCKWCVWSYCMPTATEKKPFIAKNEATAIMNQINIRHGMHFTEGVLPILLSMNELQRQETGRIFSDLSSGISLASVVQGLSFFGESRLKAVMVALATPLPMYFAQVLDKALERRDLNTFLEIYFTLPSCLTSEINEAYNKLFDKEIKSGEGKNLHRKIVEKFFEDFGTRDYINFLVLLTEIGRDSNVNEKEAKKDAKTIVDALVNNDWQDKFPEIYSERSVPQLKNILNQYQIITNGKDFGKPFETDKANPYRLINKIVRDQHGYFADELYKILANDIKSEAEFERLLFIIRGRSDIDLGNITLVLSQRVEIPVLLHKNEGEKYREALLKLAQERIPSIKPERS